MKKMLTLLITVMVFACSLPKDNLLDPNSESGINAPIRVSGIEVSHPTSGYVPISWDQTPDCSGYYIYRSESYYGEYVLHKEIDDYQTANYNDNDYVSGTFYYYKLSAYKQTDDGKLEGYRSGKFTWN